MTENERLNEALEDFEMFCKGKILCVTGEALEMIRTAIKEREQYRAISTIEECKNNKVLADKRYEHFFDGIEQLEKYKAIGTVEELQALKEKMQVIQIILEDMKYQIGASGEHMDKKLSEWINKLKG